MINGFVSLRVPEIALAYAKARVVRIGQIHILPRDPINRVELASVQKTFDWSNEGPGRQALDQG